MTDKPTGSRLDPWVQAYASRATSMRASEIRALFAVASRPEVVSLAGGMPFVEALDVKMFRSVVDSVLVKNAKTALQYGAGQGHVALRESVLEVMRPTGMTAHPDDIVITAGSQMAIDLIVRVMCNPGDVILVESPSYVGALGVFRAYEADIRHVAMDADGLNPTALKETIAKVKSEGKKVKLLYTIPSFHNPAGITQPQSRRAEILEIAEKENVLIIEDDPYALLSFDGVIHRPMAAVEKERVVYCGSFSKIISAGLRIGWAVAPHALREKLVLANEAATLCPSNFTQLIVDEYLRTQDWLAQVAVFRNIYQERRDALLGALKTYMPTGVSWTVPTGGFYSWLTLPNGFDATAMLPRAVTHLVAYVPGTGFFADGQGRSNMRLSFCYPPPERIVEGVKRLSAVMQEEAELLRTFGVGEKQ
jgi:DNA-binding transcriptional MocR family regulator